MWVKIFCCRSMKENLIFGLILIFSEKIESFEWFKYKFIRSRNSRLEFDFEADFYVWETLKIPCPMGICQKLCKIWSSGVLIMKILPLIITLTLMQTSYEIFFTWSYNIVKINFLRGLKKVSGKNIIPLDW